jgi:hypothetical protein
MVPRTRRQLLHGTVGLLAGLAGCGESSYGESTESESHPPKDSDTGTVPEHYSLRHSADEPPVRLPHQRRRATSSSTSSSSDSPPENARERGFITSTEAAEQLWIADIDGATEARQFVTGTDFDTETLYIEYQPARECHYLKLCSVTWSATDIDTQYGSYYRSPDVSCDTDADDGVSWLIRIPEVLNPDAITGHGSGWSSNGCRRQRDPSDGDETTTDNPDFGPKPPANRTETATEDSQ